MADARVPMTAILGAFGLSVSVARPSVDTTPIVTVGVWVPSVLEEQRPFGTDFQRRESRRVLAIPRSDALQNAPRGTVVVAAEIEGTQARVWRVDGYAEPTNTGGHAKGGFEVDMMRLILIPANP